jgi:hypothetical protein
MSWSRGKVIASKSSAVWLSHATIQRDFCNIRLSPSLFRQISRDIVFRERNEGMLVMRKLLIGTAAIVAAAAAATPASAQYYGGYGYSPYSYGYGYNSNPVGSIISNVLGVGGYGSYGSYGYGYPSYGYSYPSYGYSSYGYGYPSYGYNSYGYNSYGYNNPCLQRHHRNGVVYYTRVC